MNIDEILLALGMGNEVSDMSRSSKKLALVMNDYLKRDDELKSNLDCAVAVMVATSVLVNWLTKGKMIVFASDEATMKKFNDFLLEQAANDLARAAKETSDAIRKAGAK